MNFVIRIQFLKTTMATSSPLRDSLSYASASNLLRHVQKNNLNDNVENIQPQASTKSTEVSFEDKLAALR